MDHFSARYVNPIALGAATNCITNIVMIKSVVVNPKTAGPKTPANAVTLFIPSIKKKYANIKKNSVLNSFISESVFRTSLMANLEESIKLIFSISFSISGSGTSLNVIREKPNHQIPDVAIQNGITQSPVTPITNPRCTTSSKPPPR